MRARKVVPSSEDALLLEAHVSSCESCRLLLQVLDDFDRAAVADAHDAARIERLASFARHTTLCAGQGRSLEPAVRRPSGLPGARGLRGLLAAAAVFLMVAGASAAIFVQRAVQDQERVTRQGVLPSELGVPAAEGARRVALRVRADVRAETEPVGALLERPEELLGLATAPAATALGGCPAGGCFTPTVLFKQANEARREGRTQAALEAYRELQRRAPSSREAQLSHLSLGNLLLATGENVAALSQFDAALRSSAARRVQAEALYGRGLALGRLGKASEERANWRRLLAEFASSPYAAHARRRLDQRD